MTRRRTRLGRRTVVAAAILVVVVVVGSACRLVQPPVVSPADPTGVLESVQGGRGTVTVTGWATQLDIFVGGLRSDRPIADDRARPILIAVLVDGE